MNKYFLFLFFLSLGIYGEEDFFSLPNRVTVGGKFPEEGGLAWKALSSENETRAAFRKLMERAKEGDREAQYELGTTFLTGINGVVNPNFEESFHWILKAAHQGHREARQWILEAAEQGHREARYWLFAEVNQYHEDGAFKSFARALAQGAKLAESLPEGQVGEGNSGNCYLAISGDSINNLFR